MTMKRVKVELTLEVDAYAHPEVWDWPVLIDIDSKDLLGVRVEEVEVRNETVPTHVHGVWLCDLLREAGFAPAKWLPAGPRLAQAASGKLVEIRLNDPHTREHYSEVAVEVIEPTTLATVRRSFPFPWRHDGRSAAIIGYTIRPETTNLFHAGGPQPTPGQLADYFREIDLWLSGFGARLF